MTQQNLSSVSALLSTKNIQNDFPTTFIMQYTISEALFCMTQQNLSSVSALLSPKIDSELPTWYSILSLIASNLHSLCSVTKTQKENTIPRTAPALELLAVNKFSQKILF